MSDIRTVVTFQSSAFNTSERKDYFINNCCYGDDVARVIAEFDQLYPGFTEGKARERNESLDASLGFSLRRLSDAARERLPALGAFEGGALEIAILQITGLKPSEWREVRAELERAGLATPDMEMPVEIDTEEGPFSGCYLRFHPTLCPYLRRQLTEDGRQENLEELFFRLTEGAGRPAPALPGAVAPGTAGGAVP